MKQKGFTIIELIFTIAILSFGIVGVYSSFAAVSVLTYSVGNRFTAAYLAQEGLEIMRNMRDNNFINGSAWTNGLLICSSGCQADYKTGTSVQLPANQLQSYGAGNFLNLNVDGFYSYDAIGTPTIFKRKITMVQDSGPDSLKVNVLVTWMYRGQVYNYEASEYLYNWY